jgi:hypothetical protein
LLGAGINPRHFAKIEQHILSGKKAKQGQTRSGPPELRALGGQILAARQHMNNRIGDHCTGLIQHLASRALTARLRFEILTRDGSDRD